MSACLCKQQKKQQLISITVIKTIHLNCIKIFSKQICTNFVRSHISILLSKQPVFSSHNLIKKNISISNTSVLISHLYLMAMFWYSQRWLLKSGCTVLATPVISFLTCYYPIDLFTVKTFSSKIQSK